MSGSAELFTEPTWIGNAFGPGKQIRSCLICGAVVLDDYEYLELHRASHGETSVPGQALMALLDFWDSRGLRQRRRHPQPERREAMPTAAEA